MARVRYYDDELDDLGRSIFLAGPTAGAGGRTAWRARALELLDEQGWDGEVVIPEFRADRFVAAVHRRFGAPPSPVPGQKTTSYNVLRWETRGIETVTVVLFWMPFALADKDDPASLPGFTTRAEVSRELARAPGRIVLGMPPTGVMSAGHIRYHAHHQGVPIHDTLEATVAAAIALAASQSTGSGMSGGTRK